MPNQSLDPVFRALADPTRRAVLERGGLVRSRKSGRVRTYRLVPQPLHVAARWLEQQRAVWERRLDQLDDYLITLHAQPKERLSP